MADVDNIESYSCAWQANSVGPNGTPTFVNSPLRSLSLHSLPTLGPSLLPTRSVTGAIDGLLSRVVIIPGTDSSNFGVVRTPHRASPSL